MESVQIPKGIARDEKRGASSTPIRKLKGARAKKTAIHAIPETELLPPPNCMTLLLEPAAYKGLWFLTKALVVIGEPGTGEWPTGRLPVTGKIQSTSL
jgi:hypothetical protein